MDESRYIYLDHSATTPVAPEVFAAMEPFLRDSYGNPSSLHAKGREAASALDRAREQVAAMIGATPEEIIFTGSGSESDNLAIKGAVWASGKRSGHIITSAVEHHAIMDTVKWLARQGFDHTFLPVDEYGMVSPADLERAIRDDTIIVSIMHGNNEVGTINPVGELARVCRERGVLFHADTVQTAGHIEIDAHALGPDMMTLSAHKMYGPKGIAALYMRKGIKLTPLVHGGGQEYGLRSGTESVPLVVGFGAAAELAGQLFSQGEPARLTRLRDKLIDGIVSRIPDSFATGHRTERLPFHASVCIRRVEGEGMLLRLDHQGIAASSGSACTSGSLDPSHVLLAMGLDHATAHGSIRMTLGRSTTEADIDRTLEVFPPIVETLRKMSPFKG